MTSGVYGLECPDTGAVRYVGASRDIEGVYRRYCFKSSWRFAPVGPLMDWLVSLHKAGKQPGLAILAEANEDQLSAIKAAWLSAMRTTGEADLNRGGG